MSGYQHHPPRNLKETLVKSQNKVHVANVYHGTGFTQRPRSVPADQLIKVEQGQGILIVGKPRSGKTTLLRQILHKGLIEGDWSVIFILCKTLEGKNHDYDWWPMKDYKKSNPTEDDIKFIMQWSIKRQCRYKIAVVLDDIIGERKLARSSAIEELYASASHYNITPIALIQQVTRISNTVRTNAASVFITRASEDDYEHALTYLPGGVLDKHEGKAMMHKYANNYQFIRINSNSPIADYWFIPRLEPVTPQIQIQEGSGDAETGFSEE